MTLYWKETCIYVYPLDISFPGHTPNPNHNTNPNPTNPYPTDPT